MRRSVFAPPFIALALLAGPATAYWPQWGGPTRDFVVARQDPLAWTEGEPAVLWRRPLGPGYSAIAVRGDRLFTMTRRGDEEVVLALAAKSGRTLWENAYLAPVAPGPTLDTSWGEGPNATPLVFGGRVYTFGFTAVLSCLDEETGDLVWRRGLAGEVGGKAPYFGHSASPMRHGDTVIVPAGGAMAFHLETGEPVWSNTDFEATYASPRLWRVGERTQLVVPAAGEIVGLDPEDGRLLWRHPHANSARTILSDALPGDDGVLFASAYFLGSIGLALGEDGESVQELWQTRRLQLAQSNAIRVDGVVYGFHNSILTAVDVASGEVLWRERGFERSNLLKVGEGFLLFDRLGKLSLVSLDRQGVTRHVEAQLLEGRSWTAPTLVGDWLYARNLESIVAVDLARPVPASMWTAAGASLGIGRVRPDIEAPPAFLEIRQRLMAAYRRGDGQGIEAAAGELEPWAESEPVGHLASYYLGFAAYQRALAAGQLALPFLRQAESHLNDALEADPGFADAHALQARIFPMYYRFDPRRAAVVGSLGDDHLDSALRFEPGNPRVLAIQALDLISSPAEYGGDPENGLAKLRRALDRFAEAADDPPTVYPEWGHASAWAWYAEALVEQRPGEKEAAEAAFRKALELAPDLRVAQEGLAALGGEEGADP